MDIQSTWINFNNEKNMEIYDVISQITKYIEKLTSIWLIVLNDDILPLSRQRCPVSTILSEINFLYKLQFLLFQLLSLLIN